MQNIELKYFRVAAYLSFAIFVTFTLKSIDPFLLDASISGWRLFLFNVATMVYGPLLFASITGFGIFAKRAFSGFSKDFRSDFVVDLVECFFIGCFLVTILYTLVGMLGLLSPFNGRIGFVVGLVGWSTADHRIGFSHLFFRSRQTELALSPWVNRIFLFFCLLASLSTYKQKFLNPPFDGDSMTHYLPYYLNVTESGSLAPNSVWYHFFYSKGCALFFWAMSCGNSLAAIQVNGAFFLLLTAMIWSLIASISSRIWASFSVAVLMMILRYQDDFLLPLKQHFILGVCLFGLLWLISKDDSVLRDRRAFFFKLTSFFSLSFFCVAFVPTSSALILGFSTLGLVFSVISLRDKKTCWFFVISGVGAMTSLALIMVWNYSKTGMLEINPFRFFWARADQVKFSQWTSPYMVLLLEEGTSKAYGVFASLSMARLFNLNWYSQIFRLGFLAPLGIGAKGVVVSLLIPYALLLFKKKIFNVRARLFFVYAGLLLIVCAFNSFLVQQETSIIRMLEFTEYVIAVIIFSFVGDLLQTALDKKHILAMCGLLIIVFAVFFHFEKSMVGIGFLTGKTSLVDQYRSQGHYFPEVFDVKSKIGVQKRVFSFHTTQGELGLVPGRRLETELDYSYRYWHRFLFEAPEIAENELKAEGLNYFLVDFNFFGKYMVSSLLLSSPLFSAEEVNQRFAIVAESGDAYILGWRDQLSPKMKDDFLAKWRNKRVDFRYQEFYDRLHLYYLKYKENYPIHADSMLPPLRGWQ